MPRVFAAIGAPIGHRACQAFDVAVVDDEHVHVTVRCECGRWFDSRRELTLHHAAVVDGEGRVTD